MKPQGIGTVLPEGTIPMRHGLTDGAAEVRIEAVDPENGYDETGKPVPSDHMHARCVYPCGFVKDHQVKDVEDLLPKVVSQLRGRYGVQEVKITKAPKSLAAGGIIAVEVVNGSGV